MFDSFIGELAKSADGVHHFNPPATEWAILATEWALGARLPSDYKHFLRLWNGGVLFAMDDRRLIFWSVMDQRALEHSKSHRDIVRNNQLLVQAHGLPLNVLAIASYTDGRYACLNLEREGGVMVWERDTPRLVRVADKFEDWLNKEIKGGTPPSGEEAGS